MPTTNIIIAYYIKYKYLYFMVGINKANINCQSQIYRHTIPHFLRYYSILKPI